MVRKRIDEISIMKALGILFIVFMHMLNITGASSPLMGRIIASITTPVMVMFFLLSGYTSSIKKKDLVKSIYKKVYSILSPYYRFAVIIILVDFIIYVVIERKTIGWFIDGVLGILFQLQSFHMFDTSVVGVHSMFYGVIVGWYLFQFAVSLVIFLIILNFVQDKNKTIRLILSIVLISLGAVLYSMNLQGLNGEFFPPVCKIFIIPNIPGIAGLLMLGNYLSSISIFDFDEYSTIKKTVVIISSAIIIFVLCKMDDYIYDFPIGKWGPFGALSYFSATIYGLSFSLVLGILSNQLKKIKTIRNALVFLGDNTMDVLVMHFFIGFLTAYLGGFWYDILSEPIPEVSTIVYVIRMIILLTVVLGTCIGFITIKTKVKAKKE